jgi:solute carrier family 25 (mitochondrial phosphate transporter), member 23/24/25/41
MVTMRQTLSQPVVAAFIAGGVAGAVSRTVVSPLERLKILYQVQSAGRNEYKMPVHKALAKMWREEGFRGFMAGNGTNCIRIVPYSAVQFGAYNFYKRVCITFPSADTALKMEFPPLRTYTMCVLISSSFSKSPLGLRLIHTNG